MGVDPGLDDQRVEGLDNIVHGPQGEALLLVFNVVEAGNQDDRDVLGNDLFLKLFQQHEAVHIRHDHVQQHQGEFPGGGKAQPVLGGVDHGDVILLVQNGF